MEILVHIHTHNSPIHTHFFLLWFSVHGYSEGISCWAAMHNYVFHVFLLFFFFRSAFCGVIWLELEVELLGLLVHLFSVLVTVPSFG